MNISKKLTKLDGLGGVIYYELRLAQWILEKLNYYRESTRDGHFDIDKVGARGMQYKSGVW